MRLRFAAGYYLISMTDLLTSEESAVAAAAGWMLCNVFDSKDKRWQVAVLPLVIGQPPLHSADRAGLHVINQARSGNALAIKALQLVMGAWFR